MTVLLVILKNHTDASFLDGIRTLVRTPRNTEVSLLGTGHYSHYVLVLAVENFSSEYLAYKYDTDIIKLIINIDGAKMEESSEKNLWIAISDIISKKFKIVGIYHGVRKPTALNEFLKPLVAEIISLVNNGFEIEGKKF